MYDYSYSGCMRHSASNLLRSAAESATQVEEPFFSNAAFSTLLQCAGETRLPERCAVRWSDEDAAEVRVCIKNDTVINEILPRASA